MRQALLLTALLCLPLLLHMPTTQAELSSRPPVREWFADDDGCDGRTPLHSDENTIELVWALGEQAMLAAERRADALDADACSYWQEGSPYSGADAMNEGNFPGPALAGLDIEVRVSGESQPSALEVTVGITTLEYLPDSVGLRLLITLDHAQIGQTSSYSVVKHYQWSSAFHHGANMTTDWNETIDASRFAADGVPFTHSDLWRLTVVALLVDDLNHSIHAAASADVPTPSSVPATSEAAHLYLLALAVLAGLGMVVRAEWKREVCLPKLTGRLVHRGQVWTAHVSLEAGRSRVTLKGAAAEAPWRVPRGPKHLEIKPSEQAQVSVKLKTQEESPPPARTHWTIEVEGLGGWVLDLTLTPETFDSGVSED